jgi:hypothetical protein
MKMKERLLAQFPIDALVQLPLSVQDGKEVGELAYVFRGTEEEKAVLVQCVQAVAKPGALRNCLSSRRK